MGMLAYEIHIYTEFSQRPKQAGWPVGQVSNPECLCMCMGLQSYKCTLPGEITFLLSDVCLV